MESASALEKARSSPSRARAEVEKRPLVRSFFDSSTPPVEVFSFKEKISLVSLPECCNLCVERCKLCFRTRLNPLIHGCLSRKLSLNLFEYSVWPRAKKKWKRE